MARLGHCVSRLEGRFGRCPPDSHSQNPFDLLGNRRAHSPSLLLCSQAVSVLCFTYSCRATTAAFCAGASHQLRDATRRGLWLSPPQGPKTPPLTYPAYLVGQAILPLAMSWCHRCVDGTSWSRVDRDRCVSEEEKAAGTTAAWTRRAGGPRMWSAGTV